jgi:transposase InsO family protein
VIEQKIQVQGSLSIVELCQLTGVSRASYYRRWQTRKPAEEELAVRNRIQEFALKYRHYGYRPMTRLLKREGWIVNHKRVLRLMREDNLLSLRRKKFVLTTDSDHQWQVYPNLARRMSVTSRDQLWAADITYVRLQREFIYVAVILDVYSRRVVGWAVSRKLDSTVAQHALAQAIRTRKPGPGLVHHSDRGWQYACGDYVNLLEQHGIEISMSRPGNPYDNAFAETFMKTLKTEEVDARGQYRSFGEAQQSIGDFIEGFYNRDRLHSALGYRSPLEFENRIPTPAMGNPVAANLGGSQAPPQPRVEK